MAVATPPETAGRTRLLTIAILAMGGEGGGVLVDWLIAAAESAGFIAQATSVPGVAQRTGATVYYVEFYPQAQASADGAEPVLALMPMPGDVDVVVASELMEAGRAVVRGFVEPSRTTLIASTHRVYAMAEKTAPGDGRVDSAALLREVRAAARRAVLFDMERIAREHGSVISAALFGALAGAGVLPFGRQACEDSIRRGGVGVAASLAAFDAAFARAQHDGEEEVLAPAPSPAVPASFETALQRFGRSLRPLLAEAVLRLLDYQDARHATLYLQRVERIARFDSSPLTEAVARYLALWMSYEDAIRVADLKTRRARLERIAAEVRLQPGQLLEVGEYLHPRLQEVADILPAAIGRRLLAAGVARRFVERRLARGRTVRTTSLGGFLLLYLLAGLRRWRRATLRYQEEEARIEAWLAAVERAAAADVALAREVALCARLLKGYGETYERGRRHFERILEALRQTDFGLSGLAVSELREAALADDEGRALKAALARHGLTESAA